MFNKINAENYAPINNACLLILAGTALTWVLVYAKTILMPFVIAGFLGMVLNTLAQWMRRQWKVPYMAGVIAGIVLFLGMAVLSVAFVSSSISSFVDGINMYTDKLNATLAWSIELAQKAGLKVNDQFLADSLARLPLFNMVRSMGSWVMAFISNIMLVSLFLIFLFMGRSNEDTRSTFSFSIEKQISYYLIVKTIVSLLAAVLTWFVLKITGSQMAGMFAVLTFVLNFIPNIGAFIATALPLPVLFLQYGFDWHIIAAVILLTATHFVVGNILETRWLGKGMDLNPLIVIASLIFWALVWGPMGALLAVPLTSIIKMILERNPTTKPFAELLAGRLAFK
ncbi:MAG: AI-2E family transporter [Elusimicrobiaceae bacterium]|nr:AI-2E family transporter [Elusimicrobiaceae bacterium]